jgi:outer membrane protein
MKSVTLIPAALIVFAAALASCNKEQPKTAAAAPSATAAKPADGIVFVNSDSLLANYSYSKEITAAIREQSRKAEIDITAKGNAYQKEVNDYQRAYATMSADQRAATEDRLGRKQRELQSLNQNAQSALANESAAQNNKLYDKVAAFLKKYAKGKGLKMVLTYSRTNPTILFGDESLDVTKEVVDGLNSEYKKE